MLVHHYINQHSRRLSAVYPGISLDALKMLSKFSWPGNVRVLSNLMAYLVNVVPNGEVIDERLFPPNITKGQVSTGFATQAPVVEVPIPQARADVTLLIENMERQLIEVSLLRHKNKQKVAGEPGIGIATLYRKVKKYGLQAT